MRALVEHPMRPSLPSRLLHGEFDHPGARLGVGIAGVAATLATTDARGS